MSTRALTAAIVATLFAGCSTPFLNEGATRLQYVRPGAFSNNGQAFRVLEESSNTIEDTIQEGQYFSVSLISAHICNFRESALADMKTMDTTNPGDSNGCSNGVPSKSRRSDRVTRGEIAIVANFGEASSSTGLSMNPTTLGSRGRVIYYSNDVRRSGQLLNAMNVPIYGPRLYSGKPAHFELAMLELDGNEKDNFKALLSGLSDLGSKSYPPSAPILGVLNMLGGTLLTGNSDDVELKFQMRFDPPGPKSGKLPIYSDKLTNGQRVEKSTQALARTSKDLAKNLSKNSEFASAAAEVAIAAEVVATQASNYGSNAIAAMTATKSATDAASRLEKDAAGIPSIAISAADTAKAIKAAAEQVSSLTTEPTAFSNVSRLPLAEGYYAFIREENRDNDPEWQGISIDPARGVVCKKTITKGASDGSSMESCNTYRDRTWFLVRVARETGRSAADIDYGEVLNKFTAELSTQDTMTPAQIRAQTESLLPKLIGIMCRDKQAAGKNGVVCQ